MTTAVERFKMLLSNALERVCVLEEQLEAAQLRIQELETEAENGKVLAPEFTPVGDE